MRLSDLTIVVPTKNEGRNIERFLQSLPPEVVTVVVDASSDRTREVIRALRPERTEVLRDPGNIPRARQLGAERSETPWVLFTDADVAFAAEYFERLAGLDLDSEVAGVCGTKASPQFPRYARWFVRGQTWLHRRGIAAATGSNMLMRRDAFRSVGGFNQRLSCNEDSEIMWRVQRAGYRVEFCPDLVVWESDARRLQRGVVRKTLHSLVRCSLLYFDLLPPRLQVQDWGYWSSAQPLRRAGR